MGRAKDIRVAPVDRATANALVRRLHYSGKVVANSQVHLGVFLDGRLHGAMQFGPPIDRRKLQGLVAGTEWYGFLELNRLAFADTLPRNSESRALGVALRLLRRHYPALDWVVSFADAALCGDGAIYRAAGFVLTDIRPNRTLWRLPDGRIEHKLNFEAARVGGRHAGEKANASDTATTHLRAIGAVCLKGFQLRYLYFLDPAARQRLTVPVIPFDRIGALGAGMHRGQPIARAKQGTGADHAPAGGAAPTRPLHDPGGRA